MEEPQHPGRSSLADGTAVLGPAWAEGTGVPPLEAPPRSPGCVFSGAPPRVEGGRSIRVHGRITCLLGALCYIH